MRVLKIKTDYDQCDYITAEKVYFAQVVEESDESFFVILSDDENEEMGVIVGKSNPITSAHFNEEGAWEIVEEKV